MRYTPEVLTLEVHAMRYTTEVLALGVHALRFTPIMYTPMEVFYEYMSQLQLGFRRCHIWVSGLSHMGFSHRRSVLIPLFRTLHGLLRYQR